jgi:hypothetical protein
VVTCGSCMGIVFLQECRESGSAVRGDRITAFPDHRRTRVRASRNMDRDVGGLVERVIENDPLRLRTLPCHHRHRCIVAGDRLNTSLSRTLTRERPRNPAGPNVWVAVRCVDLLVDPTVNFTGQ